MRNHITKLLNKLKSIESRFIIKNLLNIIRILGILIISFAVIVYTFSFTDKYARPTKLVEFTKLSVMITNLEESSGGSGLILASSEARSEILTNKHVCAVAIKGGLVHTYLGKYLISNLILSPDHDLCIITINTNLNMNSKLARTAPETFSNAIIAGHPNLLPSVITKGHFSNRMFVKILTGFRPCEKEDIKNAQDALTCLMGGGMPILTPYDAQLVTGTIMPGSSGSPVFNEDGEVAGLVFAGNSKELSYAFIVPWEYLREFVSKYSTLSDYK